MRWTEHNLSEPLSTVESMFESAAVADPIAHEASLVERIAELERQ